LVGFGILFLCLRVVFMLFGFYSTSNENPTDSILMGIIFVFVGFFFVLVQPKMLEIARQRKWELRMKRL